MRPYESLDKGTRAYLATVIFLGVAIIPVGWAIHPVHLTVRLGIELVYLAVGVQLAGLMPVRWTRGLHIVSTPLLVATALVAPGAGVALVAWLTGFYLGWLGAPGKPTILFYGHYDVQPPDPLDEWKSPPFEPDVRGDNIYARGACDDKGQTYILIKAVEGMLRTTGSLPVTNAPSRYSNTVTPGGIEGEDETVARSATRTSRT